MANLRNCSRLYEKKSVPSLTTVYILLHQHIDYIGKGDGPPTHDAYRS